jgi:CD109 antigen
MKHRIIKIIGLLVVLTFLIGLVPACSRPAAASSYIAVLPKVLHSGRTAAISLALFSGDTPARDKVEVILTKDGQKVASAQQTIDGRGTVSLDIPRVADGQYEIQVKGSGFSDKASINVENSFMVFIETDKPIYKPGQTVHLRVLTLDPELKPVTEDVAVDILDAKGIKIFHADVTTDDYGMGGVDLPISDEPNLGVWKINAATDKASTELDVRVEEYVLPKYEVTVDLPREWFLVDEPIQGRVTADYSFGKPVSGEVTIVASKYVGQWEEYATLTREIDGEINFELPAAGYVAGTPASGGQGNIKLDITVTEKTTGYVEKTSRLLTVAQSSVNLQLITEGSVFKPGLPFNVLLLTETPDNQLVERPVKVTITYMDDNFQDFKTETQNITTSQGKALLELAPPDKAIAMMVEASSGDAYASQTLQSSYSPSGNFIHLEQVTEGTAKIGQEIVFKVYSTDRATNFYYEVLSRGTVVFSDYSNSRDIKFQVTPLMAPSARLLVYQILPNSEVAADYLPFEVEAVYPLEVSANFSQEEATPGDNISLNIQTDGQARVGIAVVDKSVFILAENRLNLQQVFDELERLYMEPQAEIHEVSFYPSYIVPGTDDIFQDAGVLVITNKTLPQSKEYERGDNGGFWSRVANFFGLGNDEKAGGFVVPALAPAPTATSAGSTEGSGQLAEIQRVRQFFPETWLWDTFTTDNDGRVTEQVTVPDSITTWMLRAVAISRDKGLGVAESSLRVFQPFFLTIDLPYSAIRGEEFPVSVAVYNYLDTPQDVQVDIEASDWFELLDSPTQTISIPANDVGSAQFMIRPVSLGINDVKVSARSAQAADAVVKTIIIEPEGVPREIIDNITLAGGITASIDTSIPGLVVEDSGRAYIAVTSSFLTQTIDGLDALLQMPFGCGEQNMIVFAPDLYITKYLQSSGQLKPEIMAKAEKLMITGYQRELTYRRTDGSFSAFGMSDDSGSLWLTAFVLKCFSQAKGLIYIDDSVLSEAENWIVSHQNADGSFDQVGFICHEDMMGGLHGKDALTAFVAIALLEAGANDAGDRAVNYLEGKLDGMTDPYAVAITAYALELADSPLKDDAYSKLMSLAQEDESGLHWGRGDVVVPENNGEIGGPAELGPFRPDINASADIETTAYAALALIHHGDSFNASRASQWLVSKRNASGGFGSTQDTVVALQALIEYATGLRSDVDLTVTLKGDGIDKTLKIDESNYDVLQIVSVPVNAQIEMTVTGHGDAIGQLVRRFNEPGTDDAPEAQMLKIDVAYDTTEVAVNDLVTVSVSLEFNPLPEFNISGAEMIVLDISVPTGFAPVTDSIDALLAQMPNIKRYDVAGRKVIFYIEDMKPGQQINFDFQVRALYPVKAKGVLSTAYSYYQPDVRGETLGAPVTVH